ncbi:hypothetical protein ABBQ38_009233 [Trebouxia sp. C0009 RCD-2024]
MESLFLAMGSSHRTPTFTTGEIRGQAAQTQSGIQQVRLANDQGRTWHSRGQADRHMGFSPMLTTLYCRHWLAAATTAKVN